MKKSKYLYNITVMFLIFFMASCGGDKDSSPMFSEDIVVENSKDKKIAKNIENISEDLVDIETDASTSELNKDDNLGSDKNKLEYDLEEGVKEDVGAVNKDGNDVNLKIINLEDLIVNGVYEVQVDVAEIEQPEMYLSSKEVVLSDFIVTDIDLSQFDNSREQIVKYLDEYNQLVISVYENFIQNRKKTYLEFERYYRDFNDEIVRVKNRALQFCDEENELFNEDSCENLKMHKNNVISSYGETKEVLLELIRKMDKDEINMLNKYKEQKEEQIKRATS